ncbi:rhodanese-like domain-containing protein [Paucihalobacter sp.]|uniref:rhodanese-like domain-containing protein n=1 Tax=Paucihalobacter sp. TaxID=2850405 RepID=UPI002FE0997F
MQKINQIILLFSTMLIFNSCLNQQKGDIQLVSPEEMQELQKDRSVQMVDVRSAEAHAIESIPNSQNIDFNSPNFDEEVSKLDKNKPVLLYCGSGGTSAKCSAKLKDAGFKKIYELEGGISRWKYEGFDLETKS